MDRVTLRILQPADWPRPRGYANGIAAQGRIIVTGGVVGWNAAGVFPERFVDQAAQVFANIRAILTEGGAEPSHLIRMTWYLTDIDEYLAGQRDLGKAYRIHFGAHYPAMAAVQVARLIEPKAKLEIEATAVVPL
ncbi:MAG: RidA family protein [Rhizobiales bacterium]|nr:RidA family protein [Hyphomicrobiales bacterium]